VVFGYKSFFDKRLWWFWGFGNWVCFARMGAICRARLTVVKGQRHTGNEAQGHKVVESNEGGCVFG